MELLLLMTMEGLGRGGTYDTFGFSLALLEGVLVLELGSHVDRCRVCCTCGYEVLVAVLWDGEVVSLLDVLCSWMDGGLCVDRKPKRGAGDD
jgi:hypothetical protein